MWDIVPETVGMIQRNQHFAMDQSGSESSLGMRQESTSTCIRRLSPDGVKSPSAILAFSASSKLRANPARSTAEKYWPTETRMVESSLVPRLLYMGRSLGTRLGGECTQFCRAEWLLLALWDVFSIMNHSVLYHLQSWDCKFSETLIQMMKLIFTT